MTFSKRVWSLCSKVPKGRVTTYAEIARALKSKAYRAVGNALHHNTHDFVSGDCTVPCHRVVCLDGSLGGFASGSRKKIKLLKKEGVRVKNDKIVDFATCFFKLT